MIEAARVPLFDGVLELAAANKSGGLASNREHFAPGRRGRRRRVDARPHLELLLYDPQTSGGLLIAVADARRPPTQLAAALDRAAVARRRSRTRPSGGSLVASVIGGINCCFVCVCLRLLR